MYTQQVVYKIDTFQARERREAIKVKKFSLLFLFFYPVLSRYFFAHISPLYVFIFSLYFPLAKQEEEEEEIKDVDVVAVYRES
jgi:hypothetical protein